jgi:hypothetical protein
MLPSGPIYIPAIDVHFPIPKLRDHFLYRRIPDGQEEYVLASLCRLIYVQFHATLS